jgi:hypothetical protein
MLNYASVLSGWKAVGFGDDFTGTNQIPAPSPHAVLGLEILLRYICDERSATQSKSIACNTRKKLCFCSLGSCGGVEERMFRGGVADLVLRLFLIWDWDEFLVLDGKEDGAGDRWRIWF